MNDHLSDARRGEILQRAEYGTDVGKEAVNKRLSAAELEFDFATARCRRVNHFTEGPVNNITVDISRRELCAPKTTSL